MTSRQRSEADRDCWSWSDFPTRPRHGCGRVSRPGHVAILARIALRPIVKIGFMQARIIHFTPQEQAINGGRIDLSDYERVSETGDDQWQSFTYLTVDKAELYRAIIKLFAVAKSEFVLHLRPAEIHSQLQGRGLYVELGEVEAALEQLEVWGNLQSYQDNADATTLTEFYRKKLLFQFSARGEAAHAATLAFQQRLGEQAKLDARALERIADAAAQLGRLAADPRPDGGVVLTTLRSICQDADDLTARAQSFFRWLHEQTEADHAELAAFLYYKEQLIEYLRHFIGELIARGGEIATRLTAIADNAYARLALSAAEEDVGEPPVGGEDQHAADLERSRAIWLGRLMGLYGWFVGRDSRPPQSEQLRAAARAAIPRLLTIASQINQRWAGRSNRTTDLRRLAVWFAGANDDAAAHRLFRAAFVLSPARHMQVDVQTLQQRDQYDAPPDTSWLDAPPIEVSPQLRKTGRQPAGSASRRVIDRSDERAVIRRRLSVQFSREASSRETLIALGRTRLSQVGPLDFESFRLLMELVEQAAPLPGGHRRVHAVSRDGSLQIAVEPVAQPTAVAVVRTTGGALRTKDLWVEVSRAN